MECKNLNLCQKESQDIIMNILQDLHESYGPFGKKNADAFYQPDKKRSF